MIIINIIDDHLCFIINQDWLQLRLDDDDAKIKDEEQDGASGFGLVIDYGIVLNWPLQFYTVKVEKH